MTDLIHIAQHPTINGKHIAIITLNSPKTLNAMNLAMVKATAHALDGWANDDAVAMVVIQGNDKALCAGGDIKSLQSGNVADADEFFSHEYSLMYQLHTYPKPILAWGHGIVMGGGLGMLAGCSHRVVTPQTLMAMPEVSIGLFPDAGGSYFLHRMMGKVGLFLGLTGARFTGVDAYYLGLADAFCEHGDFDELLALLLNADWQEDKYNHHLLNQLLCQYHQDIPITNSQIIANYDEINRLMNAGDLWVVDKELVNYVGNSEYIKSATDIYKNGSAITKALTWRIYHGVKPLSLKEIFEMEKIVAVNCVEQGDFKEGVRALLIDKDKNPKWRYTLDDLPEGYLKEFFREFK